MTRDDFRQLSRRREIEFVVEAAEDERCRAHAIIIGPWRCSCGYADRDAGRMWDHAQTCAGRRTRFLDGIQRYPEE